ncbi:MAG: glycosyltransferase [Cyanobacteria bacterium Co-bin8]|nr:glycosyltransferase [Cyanobacteria bacterium Co-bin8]
MTSSTPADLPINLAPTVSVIVPVYNGERDLPELTRRLLAQTYPAERLEVLWVDNGSCDRTPTLLQSAVTAATAQGRQMQALTYGAVQSSYAARNQGIRVATGEILAFTDADCYPAETWLEQLVQPFTDPAVGLVAGEVEAFPGGNWLERYADRKQTLSQKSTLAHPFCPYGQTANLAVRATIFKQVGLFRPHLTSGGDADFCWRAQREGGWQLAFAEQAIVQHHHRDTLEGLRRQWYRYGCSNRYLHELHGIDLTRELTQKERRYRLGRWLLKELPLAAVSWAKGQGAAIDLLITPLDLVCFEARTRGQQQARLPEAAHQIEGL